MSEKLYFGAMSDVDGFQYKPIMAEIYNENINRRSAYNFKNGLKSFGDYLYTFEAKTYGVTPLYRTLITKIRKSDYAIIAQNEVAIKINDLKFFGDFLYCATSYTTSGSVTTKYLSKISLSTLAVVGQTASDIQGDALTLSNDGLYAYTSGSGLMPINKVNLSTLTIVATNATTLNNANYSGIKLEVVGSYLCIIFKTHSTSGWAIATLNTTDLTQFGTLFTLNITNSSTPAFMTEKYGQYFYAHSTGVFITFNPATQSIYKTINTEISSASAIFICYPYIRFLNGFAYNIETGISKVTSVEFGIGGSGSVIENDGSIFGSIGSSASTDFAIAKYEIGYTIKGYRRI